MFSGCASLSQQQCKVGDWQSIGKRDGQAGHSLARFEDHKKACKSHGQAANLTLYKKGHEEGLASHCTVQSQINLGLTGERYRPVCSGTSVAVLKEANQWGYRIYLINKDISQAEYQLSSAQVALSKSNLKQDERNRLTDETQRLQDEIQRLKSQRARLNDMALISLKRRV